MKILITWIGPWADGGEAGMLISTVKLLKSKFPNAVFVASMEDSLQETDISHYAKYNIKVIPGLCHSVFSKMSKLGFLRFKALKATVALAMYIVYIGKIEVQLAYKRILKSIRPVKITNKSCMDEYFDSDCIIMCGGANISQNRFIPNPSLIVSMYEILVCSRLRKPMMIWANSFGPFKSKLCNQILKRILSRVQLITNREEISKNMLETIGVSAPMFLTADAAFCLEEVDKDESRKLLSISLNKSSQMITIGVTAIYKDFNPVNNDLDTTINRYFDSMAAGIDHAVSKLGANVVFFPHNRVINRGRNDRLASTNILERVKNKNNVFILDGDYSPEQLKGMYGCMDLFIGTRFHSCIYSLSMTVPTIVVGYGHKADGIMSMLGLKEYLLDINTIDGEAIIKKIDKILENSCAVKKSLSEKIPLIRKKSLDNLELAIKYLHLEVK